MGCFGLFAADIVGGGKPADVGVLGQRLNGKSHALAWIKFGRWVGGWGHVGIQC